jgi:hypothetical protein
VVSWIEEGRHLPVEREGLVAIFDLFVGAEREDQPKEIKE